MSKWKMTIQNVKLFALFAVGGFLFLVIAGVVIAQGYFQEFPGNARPSLFSFAPFPASTAKKTTETLTPLNETVAFPAASSTRVGNQFFPRPMNVRELATELGAPERDVEELEKNIQAQWDSYKRNPNPELENLKNRAAEDFYSAAQKALGFSLRDDTPGNGRPLTPADMTLLRNTLIRQSQMPEYQQQEEELIRLSTNTIPDQLLRKNPSVSLHIAGPLGCVAPNNCFKQGRASENPDEAILGFNAFAPCCNCRVYFIPLGCLNLICPEGAAIWDACTGICGCNPD